MKKHSSIIELIQENFIDSINERQIIKTAKIGVMVIGGVYAFGFACKILNFSMGHFINLKNTIRK